ncbi:fimbria/pilus outer membrane usher protein [Pseudomonas chlororaphis]|uniref:fimbria/pilus outer membrane usher protein n=1 Tax=Pseudomonas chlororaphis TaxID=587753 RepID=UPI003B9F8832
MTALAATPIGAAPLPPATSGDTEFDVQAMQSRGLDPKVGQWFRQAPRFAPGSTTVALTVNGNPRGKVRAHFDEQGRLCPDPEFLKQAGLESPPGFSKDSACLDLQSAWPQTQLTLDPSQEQVVLVVPSEAIANPGAQNANWSHGGVAGMFNYDAQYMDSSGKAAGVTFAQVGSEAGMNAGDWILRSRQTFTRFNGEDTLQHQAAYAQRSFTEQKKVLQAGQVSLSNSMFGAGQVLGFQVFPEAALQASSGSGALVEGIADSQSVVEVRQSGVLVYTTTVPSGPFRLQGFSLLNTRSDLEVTLTGSDGSQRQFTVPASAFLLSGASVAPGLSFGAGKLDQQGSAESPMLATVANGWQLSPHYTLGAGAMLSSPYRAAALGLDAQPLDATALSVQTTLAQDSRHGSNGVSVTASLSHNLTERIGVNLNATQQTSGFRELSDTLQVDDLDTQDRTRNQYGGGVSWADDTLGSLSLSWARGSTFRGDDTRYLRAGWSKQIGRAYVGASLEQDSGSGSFSGDTRAYLTVSIPFGSRSVSSYVNSTNGGTRMGARYSERLSQDRGWSMSTERDGRTGRTSNTGTLDMVTPVSQLSASLSKDSESYTAWTARATGGAVVHDNGFTLSPYQIGDTFGIAKVGEEAGVRLDTPAGPTWTDSSGHAVLPSLSGYKRSAIQVDTRSLAKNVDIANAWQEAEAARGSVSYIDFDVVRTRRVLITALDKQGQPLPGSASVFDADGNFVTVVSSNGSVFVPDANPGMALHVQASGKDLCAMTLDLPEKPDNSGLYETAKAVCQ